MAENESPDEISSMMEKLWGPRSAGHVDAVAAPRAAPPAPPRATGSQAEEKLPSGVVEMIEARHGEMTRQARAEMEAFQAQVTLALADLAEKVARIRDEAVGAAAAAAADVEARVLARVDGVERDASERLAGLDDTVRVDRLEQHLNQEIVRFDTLVEATRAALDEGLALRVDRAAEGLAQEAEANRAAISELQADLAAMSGGMQQFARHQEDHIRALDDVTKTLGHAVEEDRQAATALERRITETVDGIAQRAMVEHLDLRSALEARSEQSDEVISDLGDYHAALDVGMGALRSEMAGLGDLVKKVADQQAEGSDRIEGTDQHG